MAQIAAQMAALVQRLLARPGQHDGEAPALTLVAAENGERLARDILAPVPPPRSPSRLVLDAVAQKVLGAWMANRHQTLFPLAINFRRLDAAQSQALIQIMAVSLLASGAPDPSAGLKQAQTWLTQVGGEALRDPLRAALASPRPVSALLGEIEAAQLGPYAYAVALAVLDPRVTTNRLFIDYLAARLALPSDMTRSLAQRYRS